MSGFLGVEGLAMFKRILICAVLMHSVSPLSISCEQSLIENPGYIRDEQGRALIFRKDASLKGRTLFAKDAFVVPVIFYSFKAIDIIIIFHLYF